MAGLDLYTVRVMTLMTVLVSGLATSLAWRMNRAVAGMRLFSLGLLSMGVGAVVGLAGEILPGHFIALAGIAFRVGGMVAVAQGIRTFRGFSLLPRAGIAAFSAIAVIVYFYGVYGMDSVGIRLGVVSSTLTILAADASLSMFRRVPARDRLTHWSTGVVFAFVALYMAVRGAAALAGAERTDFSYLVQIEIASTICADIAFIGCAFGMLLASNTRLKEEAEAVAFFDPLTNLPNRRLLLERLLDAERRAQLNGRHLGVIYLDLDDFKIVNDTLGHEAGDDVLKSVSAAMSCVLGPDDSMARVGGDEFVVLSEGVGDRRELAALAERLKQAVEVDPLPGKSATRAQVSYGAALYPEDGESAHDVMREADRKMYHAKRRRRTVASGGV